MIHFDAHYDATMALGHLISHGGWVKRLIKEGHVPGKNYIQVALRGYYPRQRVLRMDAKRGLSLPHMAEIERRGWVAVMEDVIKEAKGRSGIFVHLI